MDQNCSTKAVVQGHRCLDALLIVFIALPGYSRLISSWVGRDGTRATSSLLRCLQLAQIKTKLPPSSPCLGFYRRRDRVWSRL